MPFKSKKQMRWMHWAEAHNKLPQGTAERWAHHTKNIKKLPEQVTKQPEQVTKQADLLKGANLAGLALATTAPALLASVGKWHLPEKYLNWSTKAGPWLSNTLQKAKIPSHIADNITSQAYFHHPELLASLAGAGLYTGAKGVQKLVSDDSEKQASWRNALIAALIGAGLNAAGGAIYGANFERIINKLGVSKEELNELTQGIRRPIGTPGQEAFYHGSRAAIPGAIGGAGIYGAYKGLQKLFGSNQSEQVSDRANDKQLSFNNGSPSMNNDTVTIKQAELEELKKKADLQHLLLTALLGGTAGGLGGAALERFAPDALANLARKMPGGSEGLAEQLNHLTGNRGSLQGYGATAGIGAGLGTGLGAGGYGATKGVQHMLGGGGEEEPKKKKHKEEEQEKSSALTASVVDALATVGAYMDKEVATEEEKQAAEQRILAKIPEVVESLVKFNKIAAEERSEASIALKSHEQTLELLKLAAAHTVTVSDPAQLGKPVDRNGHSKHANYNDNPYYGGAKSSEQRPSDVALLRGLGLM